jgi:hypothetical protein
MEKTDNKSDFFYEMYSYHVSVVSPGGTPFFKFTVPYGIPVAVLNALQSVSNHQ